MCMLKELKANVDGVGVGGERDPHPKGKEKRASLMYTQGDFISTCNMPIFNRNNKVSDLKVPGTFFTL